jgi:hypothetical protein
MGWMAGIRFLAKAGIFILIIVYRPLLGSTQPPIQWVQGALSPGGKAAGTRSIPLTSI